MKKYWVCARFNVRLEHYIWKNVAGTKLQIPYQNWCNEETMAEHQSTPVLLPLWCQHLNFTTASTTCHFCALTLQPPSAESVDVSESDMVVLDCQSLGHEIILFARMTRNMSV